MNSLAGFYDAYKQVRSRDWRRVHGAFGQMTLWPDEYVEDGWKKRDLIHSALWAFMNESQTSAASLVYSEGTAKPSED